MRALVQRVKRGSVIIKENGLDYFKEIGNGLVILLGVTHTDELEDVNFVADKCSNLRIFNDSGMKMNLSVKDVGGEALVISQFTLYGDARKGNRPNFMNAAPPEKAEKLYDEFIRRMKHNIGEGKVMSGIFGAMMEVEIINDGPVTILVESK
jgi:D-tyrosyl-tRNA(Tyr) deacylase